MEPTLDKEINAFKAIHWWLYADACRTSTLLPIIKSAPGMPATAACIVHIFTTPIQATPVNARLSVSRSGALQEK